jgi:DNA-binding transcriptional regulator YiaG
MAEYGDVPRFYLLKDVESRMVLRMTRHASPEVDGAELRELRKRAGLSVTEAAGRIGISIAYLSAIERGVRPTVAPATFLRICDAMGVKDPAQLLRSTDRDAA